jgi:hypothetical protein
MVTPTEPRRSYDDDDRPDNREALYAPVRLLRRRVTTAPAKKRKTAVNPAAETASAPAVTPGGPADLDTTLTLIKKHFAVADIEQYTLILGVAAAHYIPGEMVWLRVIGASRSGKTEMVRALGNHPDTAKMEHVTPASIRGGMPDAKKILDRLDGKLVITKDLAATLSDNKSARNTVFGLLKNVKDGELVSDFNTTEGHTEQRFSFDWVCCVTDGGFVQERVMQDILGARFTDIHWRSADRMQAVRQARMNNKGLAPIRATLRAQVHALLDAAKENSQRVHGIAALPAMLSRQIDTLANFTAWARSPVIREGGGSNPIFPPPELGTDVGQSYERIAKGLVLIGVDDPLPYIVRLTRDGVPRGRLAVLLAVSSGAKTVDAVVRKTGFPPSTAQRHLEDLRGHGLLVAKANMPANTLHPDVSAAIRLLHPTK